MSEIIPFFEITGEEESVRFTPLKNGNRYMSTYDFITVMCKQERLPEETNAEYKRKAYKNAWNIWDRLDEDKKADLSPTCGIHGFWNFLHVRHAGEHHAVLAHGCLQPTEVEQYAFAWSYPSPLW